MINDAEYIKERDRRIALLESIMERERLDALTLLTQLPRMLENGTLSPDADKLARWRSYTDSFTLCHQTISLFYTIPTIVTVHRIITT